jgi:transcriptional regulator with XRE-family HTH domain
MSDGRSPNYVDQHIGARIRLRRLTANVSQESLAEKLNITFQQIQKYEKGVNRVAASRLWDLAHALEVPRKACRKRAVTNQSST